MWFDHIINYNLVLYIGIALIVGGGVLFFVAQHFERQAEIKLFKLEQLHKSFMKAKKDEQNWCSYYLCFLFNLYICDWWFCMNKEEIVKELREILKVYHYESDTENMSKDVVTSLENIIISLTSWA